MRAAILGGVVVGMGLAACRGGGAKPPCEVPLRVQALLQTSDRANVGENGQSWPTKVVVYQLKGTTALEQLDPEKLKEEGEAALGEEFAEKRELTAYPSTNDKFELILKPDVTHLLIVAEFREALGTAWYTTYRVPGGLKDAQCTAVQDEEDPPIPCAYVVIEGSEVTGGNNPPTAFSLDGFETTCPAIAPPKPVGKKKKKKKLPKVPEAPEQAPPKAPSAPSAPSKPTAPSVPRR